MNFERPIESRANGSTGLTANWTELSATQAALATALRRAFEVPADETQRKFEELVRNLN